jgi:hypothetical protein
MVIFELLVKCFMSVPALNAVSLNKVYPPLALAPGRKSRICPRPVETPRSQTKRPKEPSLGCRSRLVRGGTYDFSLAETPPLILSPSPLRTRPFANSIREFCMSITRQGERGSFELVFK